VIWKLLCKLEEDPKSRVGTAEGTTASHSHKSQKQHRWGFDKGSIALWNGQASAHYAG
jgi:hypothetical protein